MNDFYTKYSIHHILEFVEICVKWSTCIELVNDMNGKRLNGGNGAQIEPNRGINELDWQWIWLQVSGRKLNNLNSESYEIDMVLQNIIVKVRSNKLMESGGNI